MTDLGVLAQAPLATEARCGQCVEECTIDVEHIRDSTGDVVGAYGHCLEPGEESSFIKFEVDDVKVWRVELFALARQVCAWLGIGAIPVDVAYSHCWRLGHLKVEGVNRTVFFAVGCGGASAPTGVIRSICSEVGSDPFPVLLLPYAKESQMELAEETPVVPLASLLLLSDDVFGLDVGALRAQIESWGAGDGVQDIPGYRFSPDYLVVWRHDRKYSLTESQAEIIRLLHKAWVDKYRFLRGSYLTRNLSQDNIHDVFKNKSAMKRDLLVSDRQGNYALRLPEE